MMIDNNMLLLPLAIITPLIGAMLIIVSRKIEYAREFFSVLASLCLLIFCFNLYLNFVPSNQTQLVLLSIIPNLTISLAIEPLGLLFALMSSFLWLVTTIYSIGYVKQHNEQNQTRFYLFFAITMATVMGMAFSANLFTLYLFYELLTLSTYPLVIHSANHKAKLGGRTYLAILFLTSILFFLPALIVTWFHTGNLDFVEGGLLNQTLAKDPNIKLMLLLPLFILGIGKAAIFPFHRWLPAAMVAPTPVSALLHAVAVVKGGVFAILKVCTYVFGIDLLNSLPSTQVMLYLAGASIFLASLIALRQDNLKKRLAYSTVSQLSYITVGALLANSTGIIGGAMHMAIHGVGKITLFFCAGAIFVMSGLTKISELSGIGRKMPITMTAFFIASLSIIGLPPTAGTWSKWFLIQSSLQAEQWMIMFIFAMSSLMNIFYLLPIALRAFLPYSSIEHAPSSSIKAAHVAQHRNHAQALEAPLPILLALTICTALCLILFLFPQPLYNLAVSIFALSS